MPATAHGAARLGLVRHLGVHLAIGHLGGIRRLSIRRLGARRRCARRVARRLGLGCSGGNDQGGGEKSWEPHFRTLQGPSPPHGRATWGGGNSCGGLAGRANYFVRPTISSALRPASASTALVCSPNFATLGPLWTAEPEKRKGGAEERYLPARSSFGRTDHPCCTCGALSASFSGS